MTSPSSSFPRIIRDESASPAPTRPIHRRSSSEVGNELCGPSTDTNIWTQLSRSGHRASFLKHPTRIRRLPAHVQAVPPEIGSHRSCICLIAPAFKRGLRRKRIRHHRLHGKQKPLALPYKEQQPHLRLPIRSQVLAQHSRQGRSTD